jgi:hypothetical protein
VLDIALIILLVDLVALIAYGVWSGRWSGTWAASGLYTSDGRRRHLWDGRE